LTYCLIELIFDSALAGRVAGGDVRRLRSVPEDSERALTATIFAQASAMEATAMTQSHPLHERCRELFADYPLAVQVHEDNDAVNSMVLVLQRGDDAGFYLLLQEESDGAAECYYEIRQWHDEAAVRIDTALRAEDVPDAPAEAIMAGTPIPRDGSLFGWRHGDSITALLVTYTQQTPETPEPSWAVMPLAGTAESQWPPFAAEIWFGGWFWDDFRAKNLVLLDASIAASTRTVFWADTHAAIGSNSAVVTRDLKTLEGYTLPRGQYVYHRTLRKGEGIPSLEALLTGDRLYDLGPQFA
jgi:hypothetical protein